MALGFTAGGYGNVVPDRNIRQTSKPRVLKVSFGDGYEQRLSDGINILKETFNISFVNRSKTEIQAISDFFDTNAGVTAFNFTIPTGSGEETVKVVCEDWNVTFFNTEIFSCDATLRRIYE